MLLETPEAVELLQIVNRALETNRLKKTSKVYLITIEMSAADKKPRIINTLKFSTGIIMFYDGSMIKQLQKALHLTFEETTSRLYGPKTQITEKVSVAKLLKVLPSRKNYIAALLSTL
jgi:hypothetical protein